LLHRARGCEHCHQSGYKGRTAIYELIEIDAELRQLIHEEAGEQVLLQHARRSSRGIEENGMQRVLAGDTSLEEVLRVMRM
ncbi:MAG: type II secretion system protein GspE, partial [Pseudohongiellaceae bacterium]